METTRGLKAKPKKAALGKLICEHCHAVPADSAVYLTATKRWMPICSGCETQLADAMVRFFRIEHADRIAREYREKVMANA